MNKNDLIKTNRLRFTLDRMDSSPWDELTDNLTGEKYDLYCDVSQDICNLLNRLNNRADKNAELICMDKLDLIHQRDAYKSVCEKFDKVMRKYEIDSIEKLDQVLMEQRLW